MTKNPEKLVSLLVLGFLLTLPCLATTPVTITVEGVPEGSTERSAFFDEIEVELEEISGPGHFLVPVDATNQRAVARLEEGPAWRVSLRAENWWARPQVWAEGDERRIDLVAVPGGSIEGSIQEGDAKDLEGLTARIFRPSSADWGEEVSESPCSLDGRRFSCRGPAGTYDVRLDSPGRVPSFAWGVEIPQGDSHPMGEISLPEGSSLEGWVQLPVGGDVEKTKVHVKPQVTGLPTLVDDARVPQLTFTETVSERGFFQVRGLPPGLYQLRFENPRYAPTRVDSISVDPYEPSSLHPVMLLEYGNLVVELDPPTDPFHQPWRLGLFVAKEDPGYLTEVKTASEEASGGTWVAEILDPDRYSLEVKDSRGRKWWSGTIDVNGRESVIQVELPLTRMEGRVTLDDEPVDGIDVLMSSADHQSKLGFRTDERGVFYSFLPAGKVWQIKFRHRERGIHSLVEEFEVPQRRSAERWPIAEFELPDTLLAGFVVDEDGEAVQGFVDYSDGKRTRDVETRPDGTFELLGLDPGQWTVQARVYQRDDELQSSREAVQVEENSPPSPVRLQVSPPAELAGQIIGPTGEPVAGAQIIAFLDPPAVAGLPEAHSDVSGVFELQLPAATIRADLVVFPPGFALMQRSVNLPAGPIVLEADSVAGSLEVRVEEPLEEGWRNLVLFGASFAVGGSTSLPGWSRLHGARITPSSFHIPMLEPGQYTACQLPAGHPSALTGRTPVPGELPTCITARLDPWEQLTLILPAETSATTQ